MVLDLGMMQKERELWYISRYCWRRRLLLYRVYIMNSFTLKVFFPTGQRLINGWFQLLFGKGGNDWRGGDWRRFSYSRLFCATQLACFTIRSLHTVLPLFSASSFRILTFKQLPWYCSTDSFARVSSGDEKWRCLRSGCCERVGDRRYLKFESITVPLF